MSGTLSIYQKSWESKTVHYEDSYSVMDYSQPSNFHYTLFAICWRQLHFLRHNGVSNSVFSLQEHHRVQGLQLQ